MSNQQSASNLAGALERARTLAPKLSAATDKLNEAISEAEQAICALQLGVVARVHLDGSESDHPAAYELLTFGKYGNAWRLIVESGLEGEPETESYTPLANESRETRLRAAEKLPDLVEKMVSEAEKELRRVEEKTAKISNLVVAIGGGTK